jgi:hypothetical protein
MFEEVGCNSLMTITPGLPAETRLQADDRARWSFNVGLLVGGVPALALGMGLGMLLLKANGGCL